MRFVHFSDIHLSQNNHDEFQNYFKDALIKDLLQYHSSDNPIDLVLITGDLVDRGGHSLLEMEEYKEYDSPFKIFEELFINPIHKALGIPKTNFIFIPGNHDINENEILWVDEKKMKSELNVQNINGQLKKNHLNFNFSNHRIKEFKEFENQFHNPNSTYNFSNNQSTYSYNFKDKYNIGFILINDSWRCSTCRLENSKHNEHLFGSQQLNDGMRKLEEYNPILNICLMHHPIEDYAEEKEVLRFLKTQNVDLLLYGHSHKTSSKLLFDPSGACLAFMGRAALNDPKEADAKYKPGYQIFEINIDSNKIQRIIYRQYNSDICQFIADVYYAPPEGIDENQKYGGGGYPFTRKIVNTNKLENLDMAKFRKSTE